MVETRFTSSAMESRVTAGRASTRLPRGRRADHRQSQRERILATAETILRNEGAAALGMRRLAIESGVGHVTPYKIFGSKFAVLSGLLERLVAPHLATLLARADEDPIADALARHERPLRLVAADAPFARELLAAIEDSAPRENRNTWIALASASLSRDLARMRDAGFVREDAPLELAVHQLVVAHAGAFRRWILGLASFDEYRRDHRTIFLTGALSIATEAGRERLWPALVAQATPVAARVAERRRRRIAPRSR